MKNFYLHKAKLCTCLLMVVFSTSCSKENDKTTCEVLPYADLAFFAADLVEPGSGSAARMLLSTTIENKLKDCRRMAEATESGTHGYYRQAASDPWDTTRFSNNGTIVNQVIVPRRSLNTGDKDKKDEQYNFTTAGYYKFDATADVSKKVQEDDETNNNTQATHQLRRMSPNNPVKSLEIYIAPDPKHGIRERSARDRNKPVIIEYLGCK